MNKESKFNVLASRKKNKDHLLTIGIPTFNRPRTLLRAIRSLNVIEKKTNVYVLISDNSENKIDISEINEFFDQQSDFDYLYIQNPKNLGYAKNFNQIFELSPSKKTMMLFDDDELRNEINHVINTELINSSKSLYFYHDFRYETPNQVSVVKRFKNQIRNHLNILAKKGLTLSHESFLYTVPSFVGAIYHTEDFKKNQLPENQGPTVDYLFTMEISRIRPIRRVKLKLINYNHGNNDSSNIETYSQFPQKNYEYRLKYILNLKRGNLISKKTISRWEKDIYRLYIAESKDRTFRFLYIVSRLFQLKTNIKYYLNLI
jgi:glycosyltransferase involved in cell wall biosynthesis